MRSHVSVVPFRARRWRLYVVGRIGPGLAGVAGGAIGVSLGAGWAIPLLVLGVCWLVDGLLFARARVLVGPTTVKVVNRYRTRSVSRGEIRDVEVTQRLVRWGGPFLRTDHQDIRLVCCQGTGWRALGWGGLVVPDAASLANLLGVPVVP